MRARQNYSYIIDDIYNPDPLFAFIQKNANLSDYEMYQTYNMGMDYAIFIDSNDAEKALNIISKNGFKGLNAGYVSEGARKVIIKPKNITFESESYNIR